MSSKSQRSLECKLARTESGRLVDLKDVTVEFRESMMIILGKEVNIQISYESIEDSAVSPDNRTWSFRQPGSQVIQLVASNAASVSGAFTNSLRLSNPELAKRVNVPMNPTRVSFTIKGARRLIAKDTNGFSDPYVCAIVAGQDFRTDTIKKCLNPDWNYFRNLIVRDKKNMRFIVHIWDSDRVSDDYLGFAEIDMNGYPERQEHDITVPLKSRPGRNDNVAGDICIRFYVQSIDYTDAMVSRKKSEIEGRLPRSTPLDRRLSTTFSVGDVFKRLLPQPCRRLHLNGVMTEDPKRVLNAARIRLEIIAGRGLPIMDRGGLCDPYCRIKVKSNESVNMKTRFINQTLDPVWNESFEILITRESEIILVDVFDKDKMSSEFIGGFAIDPFHIEENQVIERWIPIQKGKAKKLSTGIEYRNAGLGEIKIKLSTSTIIDLEERLKELSRIDSEIRVGRI